MMRWLIKAAAGIYGNNKDQKKKNRPLWENLQQETQMWQKEKGRVLFELMGAFYCMN